MRNHSLNLFKVNNLHELCFSYKLVDFHLPFNEGQEDRYNKQVLKIASQVSSLSGGPAAIIKRSGRTYVAIPADRDFEETVVNVVPHNVKISLLPDVYEVQGHNYSNNDADIVERFLEFEIRRQLSNHQDLWRLNTSQFFSKSPAHSQEGSYIDIFKGFKYKLVCLGNAFYICLDLSTKYIDKYRLSHYINAANVESIGTHYRRRKYVYLNGENWYAVELEGFGPNIQDHEVDKDGESVSVYSYLLNRAGNRSAEVTKIVKPTDLSIFYKYPGRTMQPHSGAASLAKLIYSPQDAEVRALHSYSIKDPNNRFAAIAQFIRQYFQRIKFNGKQVSISLTPLIEDASAFAMPELMFNKSQMLKIGNNSNSGDIALRNFPQARRNFLTTHGVINKSAFDDQFLLVPDNMDRKLVEAFKRNAEYQIKALAPAFNSFKVIRYTVKPNQAATFQVQSIEKILQQGGAMKGFALVILPDLKNESERYVRSFHDCLKNKFYPDLKVQCASAYRISSFFRQFTNPNVSNLSEFRVPEDKRPRFKSYLLYLVLEHLIVNRKWPYALAKNLHYDIYIGVDVHDRYAGFTFFFKNGENIVFISEQVPLKNRSQRSEKLKASLLIKVIYDNLKMMIPDFCPNPNGILMVRDGRSFGEEGKALKQVVSHLAADGLIDGSKIAFGVVDLHKQSAIPLRMASHSNGHNQYENPEAGTFKAVSEVEGFLFNTGFPFQIRGSAKPLHIALRDGNLNFKWVAEDLFHQAMLAFSAPDRSNSLPIIIKLIDALLEPLSATREVEEDDEYEDAVVENY